MSHLGRPDGKVNAKYSLKPVVPELEKLLGGKKVEMAPDCVGKEVEEIVNKATGGQVVLLENLRFHAEEEGSSKDAEGKKVKADKEKVEEFRKGLTALGDIYISELLPFLCFNIDFYYRASWRTSESRKVDRWIQEVLVFYPWQNVNFYCPALFQTSNRPVVYLEFRG